MKTQNLLYGILISFLFLFSCSTSDDDNDIIQLMNPPVWIIGQWLPIDSNQSFTNDFIFTENNVRMSSDGQYYLNFNNFGHDDLPGHTFTFDELIISESTYSFRQTHKFNGNIQSDQVYKWSKTSENNLEFEKWWPEGNNPNNVPAGTDLSLYFRN